MGTSGLTVSVIGVGGNNFGGRCGQDQTTALVRAALDGGSTFLDRAAGYGGPEGSELMLGHAIEGEPHQVVLATKVGFRIHPADVAPGSRRNVRREIETSLRLLQTDHLDL